jgi:hypothetical protein
MGCKIVEIYKDRRISGAKGARRARDPSVENRFMKRQNHIRSGIAAFVSIVLLSFAPAHSEELNTGQLYSFCISSDQATNTACQFFILGAVLGVRLADGSVLAANGTATERKRTHFSIPDDMSQSAMVNVFVNAVSLELKVYPEDAKLPAVVTVSAVMRGAYPCTRTK